MTRDTAYIALGSNVGDRTAHLDRARRMITALPQTRIIACSSVEETVAVGPVRQPAFLNQIVAVETALTPEELLDALQQIERTGGRERGVRWGPRTIDLDIVSLDSATRQTPRLTVPHPELVNRDFWQRELKEVRGML